MSGGFRRQKNPQVSKPTLRVSLEGPSDGAFNMSEDLNLFRRAERGQASLRVYEWEAGPWLSIGRFQDEGEVQTSFPDYRLVRRPTGGAAVRHRNEITFALAMPLALLPGLIGQELGKPSVRTVYRAIAESVVYAVQGVYPDAALGSEKRRTSGSPSDPDCFAMVDGPDVIAPNGAKLAGSALKVGREAVLLQVSIPVNDTSLTHRDVFTRLVDFVRQSWNVQTASEILTSPDDQRRALAVHVDWEPFPGRSWEAVSETYFRALSNLRGEFRLDDCRRALEAASGEKIASPSGEAVDRLDGHFLPSLGASC